METAEKWKSLTEEHRSKELQVFKYNHSFFGDKIKELETNWNSKSDDEVSIFTEITNLEAKVTQLQQQLAEADPEVDRLQSRLQFLESK